MDINLFDYKLPEELVAQYPARRRDESRLLVLNRTTDEVDIRPFKAIVEYLSSGDALVVNNTKVFKARLFGNRATGARVEIFLVRRCAEGGLEWEALVQPARRLKEGEEIDFHNGLNLMLKKKLDGGKWIVQFSSIVSEGKIIDRHGHVPLPRYIKRSDTPRDIDRYQTIFARPDKIGAVAAPTAGFHFTESIIGQLKDKGVKIIELTLHVGPGTFKPVQVEDIDDHVVDPEFATLSPEAAAGLNESRQWSGKGGGKIIAVGTTSVRTLESAPCDRKGILPFCGEVDLYIRPGHKFKFVDHLLTNFHLPRAAPLILVSAFAGRERVLKAYQKAIDSRFRFYSYGDAMLIW